ncbi:putative LRR receptor-like serine/threonine-protein kinase [Dichanthelium oligosanthes]|uniref:Putative LRR receptor-like serine/threonine-protein kinase n=1 Tax=Dichanthelium oligosanthes TaxID=888268 RepID=A0A1E5W2D9_9POAL|nr:putative LRR receptor-like serine/threonine-protein kinase [Dichanthelium oligosanthes]
MSTARLLGVSILCLLLIRDSESVSDDVSALLAFKRAIYEDPLSRLSDWNSKDKDPCTWSGVGCSAFNSRVVTLVLDHNTFMGSIPKEIGKLKNLMELNLSTNQLAGPIPSEIGDMPKITKMYMQEPKINLCCFQHYFSFITHLMLPITSVLLQFTLLNSEQVHYIIITGEINQETGKDNHADENDQKFLPEPLWLLVLEVIAAVSLLCLLTLCTITGLRKCRARSSGSRNSVPWTRAVSWKENTVISIDDDLLVNVPKINRQELAEACEDFSNIIGSSQETVVYKGTLKDEGGKCSPTEPKLRFYCCIIISQYAPILQVIEMARLSHENVAKMVGYCKESDPFSRMLVFQYPPNGTLYEHLHDGEGWQVSWPRRMKLALAIARVLRYLHTELQPPFAVAALTSSSIYLTEDFSPKIIDFERWRYLVTKPGLGSVNGGSVMSANGITDTRHKRFMDVQANTFSFGVILLELISGRATVSKDTGDLVDWARKHLEQPEEFSKLVDPRLQRQSVNQESLGIVCNVVNLCIDPEPSRRPSMSMITAILEEGIEASAATLLRDSSLAWAEAELAIS